ncbi:MAG: hypothetical protein WD851_22065 [Pirellulales bacterium]
MHQVRIHLTEATESLARVRLRPTDMKLPTGATLGGTLAGPRCRYARTLPAVFPVRDVNGTAEVLVTEPCYWTADLPFLYDLRIEVRNGGTIIESREQPIGLRRLSVRGSSVFVEGKRFVFRAARLPSDKPIDWQAWRDARLAMYVVDPDEELCQSASEQGIWMVAEMSGGSLPNHVMNCPAVAIVVVTPAELASAERLSGGALIGARTTDDGFVPKAPNPDLLVREVQDIAVSKRELAGCPRPVVVIRSHESFTSLAAARATCEQLQRDLAPELNLAGYIV